MHVYHGSPINSWMQRFLPGECRLVSPLGIVADWAALTCCPCRVWNAYATPDNIKQWNTAPDDWHTTKSIVELHVGGMFSSRMEAKDGSFGIDFAETYTMVMPKQLQELLFGDRACG